MITAFYWGLLATSSLVIGGLMGAWLNIGRKTLGCILAFGAGVLISAVAYEMVFESVSLARGSGFPALGFLVGAFTFFFSDRLIEKIGVQNRKGLDASHSSNMAVPIILATVLDGIPESIVIGLGILEGGTVSLAMLIAVFISNLPEAIAGTSGMKTGGWSTKKIVLIWLVIALICSLSSVAGYSLFANTSHSWLAFIQSFAGGAIMVMLANTMIPEAYEHGGKLSGLFTVLGFAVSVAVVLMEKAG
jgi:zinc transporter, ZIP family